ncbi:MAG: tRNA (adenosine(37)-N6)-threonylcarbamoyltransferase complex dimerization subunit type 1 TsaB [Candidatus Cloacimonetes bacterium]|nr:tRNA (adenosine(37)-N6)-threonylcarbamoyltransferase complex dimerization subunit type 1 TsaB [Candidatus Cloacimonadota bacterium]
MILTIETCSSSGSIAVGTPENLFAMQYADIRVTHSERVLPQIEACLEAAQVTMNDIEIIAVANGPGSFTGVRIGLATAKGLCFARNLPLVPINSLKLIAANAYGSAYPILVLKDARMQEVYCALYTPELEEIIAPACSLPEAILSQIDGKVIALGDGVNLCSNKFAEYGIQAVIGLPHQHIPLASAMLSLVPKAIKLTSIDEIADLEPYYLRKSQAEVVREQRGIPQQK